jgi:hypothetical protein
VFSVGDFNAWQTLSHSEKLSKYVSVNMSIPAPPMLWFFTHHRIRSGKGGGKGGV